MSGAAIISNALDSPFPSILSAVRGSDEAIFWTRRSRPETRIRSDAPSIKQWGAVMVGRIINLVYRALCRKYLIAIRHRQHWA